VFSQESPINNVESNDAVDSNAVLDDHDAEKILPYEADDSPFPEVRAVVRPVDDVELPLNTIRMWIIGILFTIVCAPSAV
jgi:hypothetical protein